MPVPSVYSLYGCQELSKLAHSIYSLYKGIVSESPCTSKLKSGGVGNGWGTVLIIAEDDDGWLMSMALNMFDTIALVFKLANLGGNVSLRLDGL